MKHLSRFSDFSLNEGQTPAQAQGVLNLMEKDPAVRKYAEDCRKLIKAMKGMGTDEEAIKDVFNSLKTKEDLIKLLAMWDSMDLSYNEGAEHYLGLLTKVFSGRSGAYEQQVKNRFNMLGPVMKDSIGKLAFWKGQKGAPETEAYLKARADWYAKNPKQKETSLNYWLSEELDEDELAEINNIVKKFGVKF